MWTASIFHVNACGRCTQYAPNRAAVTRRRVQTGEKERKMLVQPYLMFGGRCQEAVDFYRDVLGAEVQMVMRFNESPEAPPPGMVPENWGDKIMHAAFKVGDTLVMASDGCSTSETKFEGISLSLTVANEAE